MVCNLYTLEKSSHKVRILLSLDMNLNMNLCFPGEEHIFGDHLTVVAPAFQ